MKKIKALISLLAVAALLATVPNCTALTAKADSATTYAVKYVGGDVDSWRYQVASTYEDGKDSLSASYLPDRIKAGDHVVVYAGANTSSDSLDLGSATLGSLTIYNGALAVVKTGGVTNAYVLAGSTAAITGDVANAYLYDSTTCTFNSNVNELVLYSGAEATSNISCGGTVEHFLRCATDNTLYCQFYHIAKGQMKLVNGSYQVPDWAYDTTGQYASNKNQNTTNTTTNTENKNDANEYDDVPKTGDSFAVVWLLGASVLCFAASEYFKRKEA